MSVYKDALIYMDDTIYNMLKELAPFSQDYRELEELVHDSVSRMINELEADRVYIEED